jgi:hypothetical protein
VLPEQALPKTGVLCYEDEAPVCAGFLYKTDSSMAWVDWVISDQDYDASMRKEAVSILMSRLLQIAKELGFSAVMTAAATEGYQQHCEGKGFVLTNDNVNLMLKRLD